MRWTIQPSGESEFVLGSFSIPALCIFSESRLLYAFLVVAMLAGAILLHHWFQMVLWGFLTLRIVAILLRRPYHPARVEQEQPAPPRPLLPITAADQEAVNELYQQRRKQRS